jgi:hypothetical protein
MARTVAIISLFAGSASIILLSLGVLTPEMVRNLGNRLAVHISSKPKNVVFRKAYGHVIGPKNSTHIASHSFSEFFGSLLDTCVVELTVGLLTWVIAAVLSFLLLFGLSVWGLIEAANKAGAYPVLWGLSIAGILLCLSGACSITEPEQKASRSSGAFMGLVWKVLSVAALPYTLTSPLVWLMRHLVSVFTETIPVMWYRILKAIHSRGISWLFTLVGMVLGLLSLALQVVSRR